MKRILAVLILLALPLAARADSPITSTDFYRAYMEINMVAKASESKMLTSEIAAFLLSEDAPIDVKAAMINALSWDIGGKSNAELFKVYLASKYGVNVKKLRIGKLTADELFCLGYLTVMDDYFSPDKAIALLEKARRKNPESFTVAIVLALTKAQKAMDSDWCRVWILADSVFEDDNLEQDMRPEAKKIIYDYMVLYKDECK